jgi:hydroxymethylbilane synthase
LRRAFPKLEFRALRGNVNTRLAKLDRGEYDAIILAVAGLRRLGLGDRIRATVPPSISLPAICQGVLAIEHRSDRPDLAALVAGFEHRETALAARAERALGLVVEGSCEVPLGAFAHVEGDRLELEAFVGLPDGSRLVREHSGGAATDGESIGHGLGEKILAAGGREILALLESKAA